MSEQQSAKPAQERPAPAGYASWQEYWMAQGMPWRTEPEIDEEQRRFLTMRRATKPNTETGVYPFKDVGLERADVEWLLATHESRGIIGPVEWADESQRGREGLDLRGADLRGKNLAALPLSRLKAGSSHAEWLNNPTEYSELAAANCEGINLRGALLIGSTFLRANMAAAKLRGAHLEHATLIGANLKGAILARSNFQRANLYRAHLEGADLSETRLESANLAGAFFDSATALDRVHLGSYERGAYVSSLNWADANLTIIEWPSVRALGDDFEASQRYRGERKKSAVERLEEWQQAVRANRRVSVALRAQGLSEVADRFAYRAQVLQRRVLRRRHRYVAAFGSWFLDLISGYGYKPIRSFATYALVVIGFAAIYFALGSANGQTLAWNEAIVISMTAFHGRGFFSAVFQPGDLQAAAAAVEAFIGLLIEIVLIATFTQRFFAR
jgi:uncharacterized protein YjbI with pentapeptide repeats